MGAGVSLKPSTLAIDPGAEGICEVRLRNTGTVVDRFTLEVLGDAAPWALVEPPAISLFPNAEGTLQLRFRPPRSPQVKAGTMPVGVKVTPQADPTGTVVEEGQLIIGSFIDVAAQLKPRISRGSRGAKHNLAIDNRGNAAVTAFVSAADADDLLSFKVRPESVTVGPGAAGFVNIKVRPRKRFLLGAPQTRAFQAQVKSESTPPAMVDGAMIQAAIISRYVSRTVLALAVAVPLLAALMLTRPGLASTAVQAVTGPLQAAIAPISEVMKALAPGNAPTEDQRSQLPGTGISPVATAGSPAGSATPDTRTGVTAPPLEVKPCAGTGRQLSSGWASAPMCSARARHTTTLLRDGWVLAAGGLQGDPAVSVSSAELYDPTTGRWFPIRSMTAARAGQTATLLDDGRVLVVGGQQGGEALSTAELYNPITRQWSPTRPMRFARYNHTATRLKDGRVLVVGGNNPAEKATTSELYDPKAGSWSEAAPMVTGVALSSHTATLLRNGQVLVAGGSYVLGPRSRLEFSSTTQLYDGTRWRPAGSLSAARAGHTATLLVDGTVLLAGGRDSSGSLRSSEVLSPASNRWTPAASMTAPRSEHAATLIGDLVLVVGGNSVVELYDPSRNLWFSGGAMAAVRTSPTTTLLTVSGRVLVAGGAAVATSELSPSSFPTPPPSSGLRFPRDPEIIRRDPASRQLGPDDIRREIRP